MELGLVANGKARAHVQTIRRGFAVCGFAHNYKSPVIETQLNHAHPHSITPSTP
jgi:hypothetical protein